VERVPLARLGESLGRRRRAGMRIVMTPPPATTHSVTCPAFDAGPRHSDEKHDDCERNRDSRNIQHVAERVVRRRLFERLWLLSDGNEHHTLRRGSPIRSCSRGPLESITSRPLVFDKDVACSKVIRRSFGDVAHEMRHYSDGPRPLSGARDV